LEYFKNNTLIINSENKQLKLFCIILDLISNKQELLDEFCKIKNYKVSYINEEFMTIYNELVDSFFQDFCDHILLSSQYVNKYFYKH